LAKWGDRNHPKADHL